MTWPHFLDQLSERLSGERNMYFKNRRFTYLLA